MHKPFLSVRNGKVTAQVGNSPIYPPVDSEYVTVIETPEEFVAWGEKEAARLGIDPENMTFMCSSSMDFPEDSTDDPDVIALAQWIRGD